MKPTADFVFDGLTLKVPAACGEARDDQLQGTPLERLCELAGRECYDSLGKGRDSASYHEHIAMVKHGSVYEHANFTVEICTPHVLKVALAFLNRPGVFVAPDPVATDKIRVTLNLRTVLDWKKWDDPVHHLKGVRDLAYQCVGSVAQRLAPQVIVNFERDPQFPDIEKIVSPVAPKHDQERWVSLRLTGSRGLTHEQVRHGDRTAISQRSTRYVDESESAWCIHPLMHAFLQDMEDTEDARGPLASVGLVDTVKASQEAYQQWVKWLRPWLVGRGVDIGTARKQARGAARGLLGNALGSSMIFSASVGQWKWMLHQRMSNPADAEIRVLYETVLEALHQSCHAESFADTMNTEPADDGLGKVIVWPT